MTRLERLERLRDQLEERLDNPKTSSHAFAPLSAQYRDTLAQIEDIRAAEQAEEVDPVDELRERRDAKRDAG